MVPEDLMSLFSGIDLAVMAAIGVLAAVFRMATGISKTKAMVIPTGLGMLYGAAEALAAQGVDVTLGLFVLSAIKGALITGAVATLVGRVVAGQFVSESPPPAG